MKRGRNQRRRQGTNINRALDSNGPEVRIRGTANQIYDKYLGLARDATSAGDRIKAENYYQYAEHYFRLIRASQPAHTPQAEMDGESDGDGDQPSLGAGDGNHRQTGDSEVHAKSPADNARDEERTVSHERDADNAEEGERRRSRNRRPRRVASSDETSEQKESEPTETKVETTTKTEATVT